MWCTVCKDWIKHEHRPGYACCDGVECHCGGQLDSPNVCSSECFGEWMGRRGGELKDEEFQTYLEEIFKSKTLK